MGVTVGVQVGYRRGTVGVHEEVEEEDVEDEEKEDV